MRSSFSCLARKTTLLLCIVLIFGMVSPWNTNVKGNAEEAKTSVLEMIPHPGLVWKKIEFDNGDVYEGYINNETGKGEGFGTYHWANGGSYEGMFKKGKKSGFGIRRYTEGDLYEGMWKDDAESGFGIFFTNANRDYFMIAGEWREGLTNGNIRLHSRNHSISWAYCKNGEPVYETFKMEEQYKDWNGFKENLRLDDGSYYTGEYNTNGGDFVEGYGIRKYPDRSMYIGKFKEGFTIDISAAGIFVSSNHEAMEYKGASGAYARIMPNPADELDKTPVAEPTFNPNLVWNKIELPSGDVFEGYIDSKTGKIEGFGTFHLSNGESFEGMYKNGDRTGFGVYHWPSGDSYEGMWKDDGKSGFGIYLGSTDKYYYMMAGEWRKDMKDGYIRIHWRDNNIDLGLFKNDKLVGEMLKIEEQYEDWNGFWENMALEDGSFYTGEYNTNGGDFVEGYGIRTYPDGSKYIGKFKEGFERDESASGIFVSPDHEATEYKGSPDEYARIMPTSTDELDKTPTPEPTPTDELDKTPAPEPTPRPNAESNAEEEFWSLFGISTKTLEPEQKTHPDLVWDKIEYTDGDVYEGYINKETGKFERFGTYYYANGNSYEGMYKNGVKSGLGIKRYVNGDLYKGMWKNESKSGFGVFHWADGKSYEGMWEDDVRSGSGVFHSTNGDSYEGMWEDDIESGYGVCHWNNGNSYEGMWNDGVRSGFGIYRFTNGDSYEGIWKYDNTTGFGIYLGSTDRDYYMISGEWLDGIKRIHRRDHSIEWGLYKNGEPVDKMTIKEEQYEDWNGFRENLRLDDGSFYTGEYNTNGGDFVEGYGIRTYPDGSMYIGKFKEGFERDESASGIFVSPDYEVTEYKGSPNEYERVMPIPNP